MNSRESNRAWVWGALLALAGCASGTTNSSGGGASASGSGGAGSSGSGSSTGGGGDTQAGAGTSTSATGADGGAGNSDDDDQPLASSSFGTPTVNNRPRVRVTARWVTADGRNRIVCDHENPPPPAECPQCPLEPPNTVTTPAFERVERRVLRCNPPADRNGLLPVRAAFGSNGLVQDVSFPHVNLDETTALCLGRGLCRMRVPTFRSPQSIVGYDYQIFTAPPPPAAATP